jgi:hypothetical protein
MTMNASDLPRELRNDYRDLCMLRDMLCGHTTKEIALMWGCTTRTALKHIRATGSEMMRQVFVATQGDPEHPGTSRWTIEEFTANPRSCLVAMTFTHIENLEKQYPALKPK